MTRHWHQASIPDPVGSHEVTAFRRLRGDVVTGPAAELVARIATRAGAQTYGAPQLREAISAFYEPMVDLPASTKAALTYAGQIGWSDTTLARHQRNHLKRFLGKAVGRLEPLRRPIGLIDFGAGDGEMTDAALQGLHQGGAIISRVHLLDQNAPALTAAAARFAGERSHLAVATTIGDFRTTMPSLDQDTTLALGSAAFHELAAEERVELFRRLSGIVDALIIVELSQDNDGLDLVTGAGLPEAVRFYDAIIGDAYASLTADQIWPVVGVFLLGEFVRLISSTYADRGNYHLKTAGWRACMSDSGFEVLAYQTSRLGNLETGYLLAAPPIG